MKRKYSEIMDQIEVSAEMKKRILFHIGQQENEDMEKMGEAADKKVIRRNIWKKYLPVAACFAILVVGAAAVMIPGKKESQENPDLDGYVAAVGDIEEAVSAEELSGMLGFPITDIRDIPFTVTQTTYTSYWNRFGEITYDGDNQSICFRKQQGEEDISGDYNVYESEEEIEIGGCPVTLKGDGNRYYLAVWSDGIYSYSISAYEGISGDEMEKMILEATETKK